MLRNLTEQKICTSAQLKSEKREKETPIREHWNHLFNKKFRMKNIHSENPNRICEMIHKKFLQNLRINF